MINRADGSIVALSDPAYDGFAVNPSDSVDLPSVTRAIWVGGSGTVVADLAGGTTLTFTGVAAGTVLPVQARRVRATGTTATALIGLV